MKNNIFARKLNYHSAIPLYEQIKRNLILLITTSVIKRKDQLPPIRDLARTLQVNHNTILKVYYQLGMEGYIYSKPGIGYFVSTITNESKSKQKEVFTDLTREYIHNAIKMGFTFKEIILKIKELQKIE